MTVQQQSKLNQALALAKHGFFVFPIKEGAKNPPLTLWQKGGTGDQATTDPDTIRQWWERWPRANIGIATEPSQLLVLDVDVQKGKDGRGAYMELDLLHAAIPPTLQVGTPSGGWHDYFQVEHPVPCRTNFLKEKVGEGLDIRSAGGYVVAPGSELQSGTYEFVDPNVAIAPTPPDLLQLVTQVPLLEPTPVEPGRFSPEQLAEMLSHLDPSDYRDHDAWFQLMCACHHSTGGEGSEEFVD